MMMEKEMWRLIANVEDYAQKGLLSEDDRLIAQLQMTACLIEAVREVARAIDRATERRER